MSKPISYQVQLIIYRVCEFMDKQGLWPYNMQLRDMFVNPDPKSTIIELLESGLAEFMYKVDPPTPRSHTDVANDVVTANAKGDQIGWLSIREPGRIIHRHIVSTLRKMRMASSERLEHFNKLDDDGRMMLVVGMSEYLVNCEDYDVDLAEATDPMNVPQPILERMVNKILESQALRKVMFAPSGTHSESWRQSLETACKNGMHPMTKNKSRRRRSHPQVVCVHSRVASKNVFVYSRATGELMGVVVKDEISGYEAQILGGRMYAHKRFLFKYQAIDYLASTIEYANKIDIATSVTDE